MVNYWLNRKRKPKLKYVELRSSYGIYLTLKDSLVKMQLEEDKKFWAAFEKELKNGTRGYD